MQDIQDRILARIEAVAADAGLETSRRSAWANTGTVFFLRPGGVVPVGETAYSFQDGVYELTLTWGGRKVPSQVGRYDYFKFYQPYSKPSRYWELLDAELDGEVDAMREEAARKLAPPIRLLPRA